MVVVGRAIMANIDHPGWIWRTGLALVFLLASALVPAQAQTFKVLYTFHGADGANPSTVIRNTEGILNGTTLGGGVHGGYGTVFKLSKTGGETVLFSFQEANGGSPGGGLIQDDKGNLYGAAADAGNSACKPIGCGTVFKLSKTGKLTVLYRFTGWPDGV
jgi:uncharacterized repeat protein (TIGR03803 family)